MIPMTIGQVRAATGAVLDGADPGVQALRVVTDSREVRPGDLFFALRGQRLDGHGFVREAIDRGAVACVCDAAPGRTPSLPRLLVQDTAGALWALGRYYRREVMSAETRVIAVTGSNGKTTTKGMLDHVLGSALQGRASPKSFNNALGVPLTLLTAEAGDRYLVTEIGTNARGEIAALASLAAAHVGVITSIGEAHLSGLGSLAGVAAEKACLLDHLEPGGLAVVNVDGAEIQAHLERNSGVRLMTVGFHESAKLRITRVSAGLHRTVCEFDGRYRVELPMPGAHHAANAAATFAVGRWFGLEPDEILLRLASFRPPPGRTRIVEIGGITLVDDSYNANPSSVGAAIEAFKAETSRRRVFVFGDMRELGQAAEAAHERMVLAILESGVDLLVTVGPSANAAARTVFGTQHAQVVTCETVDDAADMMGRHLRPRDVVWIKASRAMGLDRLVAHWESPRVPEAAVA